MIIGLSYLDWVFLSTIFISVIIGAYRGWLPQALSMLGFFAAFVAFVKLGPGIAQWLPLSGPGEYMRDNLGALIALIGTLILGHQAVVLHKKLFTRSGPQPAHRTLGGILGMFSGVFVLLAASSIINLSEWRDAHWWKNTVEADVTHFILQSMKSSVQTP
jgi:membrane protein required for colicin V production